MKVNISIIYFALLMLAGSAFSPVALAMDGNTMEITRNVPSSLPFGETVEITLEITGETPFMVGIVETIPEGFSFPEDDPDVSDAIYFRVDRNTGKIAFSVSDEDELTYRVIPSGAEGSSFEGYWVDMLFQTQELNEGKERWVPITDPNADPATFSASAGDPSVSEEPDYASTSEAPGFGSLMGSLAIIGSLLVFRRSNSRGDIK
ncbi:hypothetical protein [Methanococcoides alaskense]|uniref:Uncharacterized protein n=1 Tax=Methanococcoides alaskense TaxID=325778 RepID=A0AA90TXW8_9EURY|nr:hypothetical protein [Methanococcoides alaskense]MDA0525333.1 hypothetical protein [Methanococcoides alaskense]MDR6221739.1 hypothetical protein [Methanococcoides alaskense]